MKKFIITGSASGLGKEIYNQMVESPWLEPCGVDREVGDATEKCVDYLADLRNVKDIQHLVGYFEDIPVNGIVNCAGVNYINNMEDIPSNEWDNVMDTNTRAIWLMAKFFMPSLEATKGVILNVVSNAAHIPMTHSIAYNASKAAAYIMTKQMARELTKSKGITVFSVSPNKLEGTGMSKYIEKTVLELRPDLTKETAKQYQLNALPAGFETKSEHVAEHIVWLLERQHRHKYLTGCDLQLGA